MISSKERPHVYYDVDYTLVKPYDGTCVPESTVEVGGVEWQINHNLIQEIYLSKARGHIVVVWSQGGVDWARAVVEALELADTVDFCLAKPSWWADDKFSEDIVEPSRRFYRDF